VQDPLITLTFEGDGFLYHMVRILTGTLLAVAQGKLSPDQVADLLLSGERKQAGMTMPPEGLCLETVLYEPDIFARVDEPIWQTRKRGLGDVQFTVE
jgi:tRNA U38,U39,U40 pseudouridine synthase TruA